MTLILALLVALGRDSGIHVRRAMGRPFTILLDPGHGGVERGTCPRGLGRCEKEVTLELAERLRAKLEGRGFRVALTRTADEHVPLYGRSLMARRLGADLFISLHVNASPTHAERGFELYVYGHLPPLRTGATAGDPLLQDLASQGLAHCSRLIAATVRTALRRSLGSKWDRGLHEAPLAVLSALEVPGVLVEVGFLDHPVEGPMLLSPQHQERIAQALARALDTWRKRAPRLGCLQMARQPPEGPAPGPHLRPEERFLVLGRRSRVRAPVRARLTRMR